MNWFKKIRKAFTELAKKREAELATAFHRAGVDVMPLSTDDDLVRAIVRFANLREQRRR